MPSIRNGGILHGSPRTPTWQTTTTFLARPTQVSTAVQTAIQPTSSKPSTKKTSKQASISLVKTTSVVIKGTGHDFPGRSSGAGSLSIWTHNIRGVTVNKDDSYARKYGGVASVKIAAGMRWREVYTEVAKHNITIVGGADPNVGVGGWILGGGHSPISSVYGMGADQVLSLEVVTADRQFLTVDETSHPDLFWALRGGGGSTFAVMVSVTIKAYPQLSATMQSYSFATSANSDTYWSLVAYFHTQVARISEAGGMGYHYVVPGSSLGDPSLAESQVLAGLWVFPNKTEEHVNKTLLPLYEEVAKADWAVDPIHPQANNTFVPNIIAYLANGTPENAGVSGRLGSWLVDGPGLSNFTELKEQFRTAVPAQSILISHVIAGPGVRDATKNMPGGENAVLPAWRKAYTHVVLPRIWPTGNETLKKYLTTELRESAMPALKKLSPDSGAYINECDPSNPTWEHDFFGENHERLLQVKHKYDPDGVFWCKPCVGWDEWKIADGPADEDPGEWGIGQGSGRLCRKK